MVCKLTSKLTTFCHKFQVHLFNTIRTKDALSITTTFFIRIRYETPGKIIDNNNVGSCAPLKPQKTSQFIQLSMLACCDSIQFVIINIFNITSHNYGKWTPIRMYFINRDFFFFPHASIDPTKCLEMRPQVICHTLL